jgi:hypothetical protein
MLVASAWPIGGFHVARCGAPMGVLHHVVISK